MHAFCEYFFHFVGGILIREWSSLWSFSNSFGWISHSSAFELVDKLSFSWLSRKDVSQLLTFGSDHSSEFWLMMESTKDAGNLRLTPVTGVTSSTFSDNSSSSTILPLWLLTDSSSLSTLLSLWSMTGSSSVELLIVSVRDFSFASACVHSLRI